MLMTQVHHPHTYLVAQVHNPKKNKNIWMNSMQCYEIQLVQRNMIHSKREQFNILQFCISNTWKIIHHKSSMLIFDRKASVVFNIAFYVSLRLLCLSLHHQCLSLHCRELNRRLQHRSTTCVQIKQINCRNRKMAADLAAGVVCNNHAQTDTTAASVSIK